VVVDNIGGRILNDTIRATALGGRIVDVGRLGGTEAMLDLNLLALRRASLIGVTFRTRSLDEHAAVVDAFIADHRDDLADGRLTPLIDRVFPFDQVPDAIARVASGSQLGKVVVAI
jgi:NADPH2:quinone reductase